MPSSGDNGSCSRKLLKLSGSEYDLALCYLPYSYNKKPLFVGLCQHRRYCKVNSPHGPTTMSRSIDELCRGVVL